jgi:hypothetical protein
MRQKFCAIAVCEKSRNRGNTNGTKKGNWWIFQCRHYRFRSAQKFYSWHEFYS